MINNRLPLTYFYFTVSLKAKQYTRLVACRGLSKYTLQSVKEKLVKQEKRFSNQIDHTFRAVGCEGLQEPSAKWFFSLIVTHMCHIGGKR